jgi:hypothetical protein
MNMTKNINTSHGDKEALTVGCMPEMSEVRQAEENWTGLTDPVLRRKFQNRLNQRIYRMLSLIYKRGFGLTLDCGLRSTKSKTYS